MKIIDRYILTSFLSTFLTVFVILFFIFILYTLWLFIPDLAGKDLGFWMILKFISYFMPTLVPLVMPLTILLASIMTFGSFGENYEFAAMKSSGMSLQRVVRTLVIFIGILSIVSFFFANDVIPYSKYKADNFRRNLAQVKPAMAIAAGQFNDIGDFNIRVDSKSGDNEQYLHGVVIHKKSKQGKNTTVTKAKKGELISSEDSNVLTLELIDGHHYEDIIPNDFNKRIKMPFTKTDFKKYIMNIDLSALNKTDLDASDSGDTNGMLNISELAYTIDSLKTSYKKDLISFEDNIHVRTTASALAKPMAKIEKDTFVDNLIELVPINFERIKILDIAYNNVSGSKFNIMETKYNLEFKNKNIKGHQLAFHEKFVIAYACLLMFFIGAPLGAIIRKGGFGLPIVFAILIFITYHFTNTFGKKVAQDGELSAFLGAWGSSIILTPLAILLTYRAKNDIGLLNLDKFIEPVKAFFFKIFKRNK